MMTIPLSEAELSELSKAALDFTAEARGILKRRFDSTFSRSYKSDGTIVTDVDTEIEERLRSLINRRFPDHGILGEELGPERPDAAFQWILDPVDGTENFSRGIPTFGIIIALHLRGEPQVAIIDHPILDLHYSARRGGGTVRNGIKLTISPSPSGFDPRREVFAMSNPVSYVITGGCRPLLNFLGTGINLRIYGDCFAHTRAVEGQIGSMIAVRNKPWDLASSRLLVEEAGGRYEVISEVEDGGIKKATAVFGKKEVVQFLVDFIHSQKAD
jgi:histidinol-phosphatase